MKPWKLTLDCLVLAAAVTVAVVALLWGLH
jgi:hypothetical protein